MNKKHLEGNPSESDSSEAKEGIESASMGLKASEIKFRELVSRCLVGIFQTTPEGIILEANPAILTALGFESVEQMNKVGLANLYAKADDRQRFVSSVSRGSVSNFETRFRCADGRIIDVSLSGNLVRDDSGKRRFIEGTFQDITEYKKAEEARRETEGKFQTLVENLNVGVYRNTGGPQGRLIHANPAIARIFGYDSVESFMQVPVADTYQNAEQRKMFIAEISEKGSVRNKILRLRRKDGTLIWASLTATAHFDTKGEIDWIDGILEDITERKHVEEELNNSQRRLADIIEFLPDAVMVIDAEGRITAWNRAMEIMTGVKAADMLGKGNYEHAIPFYGERRPVLIDLVMKPVEEVVAKYTHLQWQGDTLKGQGHITGLPGGELYFSGHASALRDLSGKIVGAIETVRDVTERKHFEDELALAKDAAESANRAKSDFLAMMSHELRTPLNSILGIAQLMERDAGFPRQYLDILRILSRSGAHLLDLINDVLEMSKIEAGKTTLDATSFDPRSFLGDLEEMTRLRAGQKGLKLLFEYKSALPEYIETDVRKLRQILINLLGNAIKYTEKGQVTLRVGCKQDMEKPPEAKPGSAARLGFEIEDTGIGIAPEDMQRIFEPFVQVNPGQTAREGTGLGLTLSRMFIELLGGEITIRSQVGRGTTFAFDIPVKLAKGTTIHTEKAVRQVLGLMPGQPSYCLLVADDSVENRITLLRLLEQCGFIVLEAGGGQEAVDLFESRQPHLIWMDLRMPGMDGYEAAQRIREAERGKRNEEGKEVHTPIIALTAGIMENKGLTSHSQVFDDWVYKPYRETEIFDMLERHLGVQFIYQVSVGSAAADKDREKGVTSAELAVLPVEWLKEFFQVLRKGHSTQLNDLIGRISPEHADLAGTLAELVHAYRFNDLILATEGALSICSPEIRDFNP